MTTIEAQIQKLYLAYYGRPADPAGLKYWVDRTDSDLTTIIDAFGNSAEFVQGYGDLSSVDLVNTVYQQTFGRDGETEGVAFYVDWLDTGVATLADIALRIVNGAQGYDSETLDKKTKMADFVTGYIERLETDTGSF